jgi:hypothetical protein
MATRANATAKNATHLKPPEFTGIRTRTDRLDQHLSDPAQRLTGVYTVGVLKGRSGIDRDTMRQVDFSDIVRQTGMRPDAADIREQYKERYAQFADIPDNRIIVMAARPKVEFNRDGSLSMPNTQNSVQEMIRRFVTDCKNIQRDTLTVKNIEGSIRTSGYAPTTAAANKFARDGAAGARRLAAARADKTRQTPLLASILGHYINNPDRGSALYPLQIVPNVAQLPRQYKIAVSNAISVDFGEVVAPLACVTGNITGNAARLLKEFLNVGSTKDLMRGATIHFNPGTTDPLVDSFIHCVGKDGLGRVVSISSKGHNAGGAATGGTSANALTVAIEEIKTNQTALKLLNTLLKDQQNRRMFDIVSIIGDKVIGSKYEKTLRLLQLLDSGYSKAELFSDLKVAKSFGDTAPGRNAFGKFSQYIQARVKETPAKRGKEEGEDSFTLFMRSSNNKIAQLLNGDPKFSETCAWVLNHSAIIQVDLYTSKDSKKTTTEARGRASSGADYGGAVVVTNVVATWPSTRVDSIKLLENAAGSDMRFILSVNGYAQQFPERAASQKYSDTDFKDSILAQHGDRDDSDLTTAKDWRNAGVGAPRTAVEIPDRDNTIQPPEEYTPPQNTKSANQQRVREPRQPKIRVSGTTGAVSVPSSTVEKINTFFKTNGAPSLSVNNIVNYCWDLLTGQQPITTNFITSFKTLVNTNPDVEQILAADPDHGINLNILAEARLIDAESQIHILATLFWTLVAVKNKNNSAMYAQAIENVQKMIQKLNLTEPKYITRLNKLLKQSAKQTIDNAQ